MAPKGQARTQSPQPRQRDGCGSGASCGTSCFRSLRGQAKAALQMPSMHSSARHSSQVIKAILLDTITTPQYYSWLLTILSSIRQTALSSYPQPNLNLDGSDEHELAEGPLLKTEITLCVSWLPHLGHSGAFSSSWKR